MGEEKTRVDAVTLAVTPSPSPGWTCRWGTRKGSHHDRFQASLPANIPIASHLGVLSAAIRPCQTLRSPSLSPPALAADLIAGHRCPFARPRSAVRSSSLSVGLARHGPPPVRRAPRPHTRRPSSPRLTPHAPLAPPPLSLPSVPTAFPATPSSCSHAGPALDRRDARLLAPRSVATVRRSPPAENPSGRALSLPRPVLRVRPRAHPADPCPR